MRLTELGQVALGLAQADDSGFSSAVRALMAAAPEHTELILALESAASAYADDLAEAAFCLATDFATNPAKWLVDSQ